MKIHYVIIIILIFLILFNRITITNKNTFLLTKLNKIAKLETTSTILRKIIYGQKAKKLLVFINLKKATYLAYVNVNITSGIDLSKLKKEDIEVKNKTIRIKLPPVEIIKYSFDPDNNSKVNEDYTRSAFLNPLALSSIEDFNRQADSYIRDHVNFLGIKETTQKNTISYIALLLKSFGYEIVDAYFSDTNNILKFPMIQSGGTK